MYVCVCVCVCVRLLICLQVLELGGLPPLIHQAREEQSVDVLLKTVFALSGIACCFLCRSFLFCFVVLSLFALVRWFLCEGLVIMRLYLTV